MKRVTGIGGIFFQARDPATLHAWYAKHLGIDVQPWGGAAFTWSDEARQADGGTTIWSVGKEGFGPNKLPFQVNYRVADARALVDALRAEGCEVTDVEDSEYGKFAWVIDPEGNRVELWEPPAAP